MKIAALIFFVGISLIMSGCTKPAAEAPTSSGITSSGTMAPGSDALDGLSAREALAVANSWKGNATVTTFVDQQQVNFAFTSGNIVSVALPADEMVIAIAPYFQNTHPCEVHYMSGCQGELVNLPFDVIAKDANGNVVIEDTYTSMENGFIELWLPRGKDLTVSISQGEKAAESVIGTYATSNTCITTMKLS